MYVILVGKIMVVVDETYVAANHRSFLFLELNIATTSVWSLSVG